MNADHRAMEGPNHSPLPDMAKLTWWEEIEGEYVNVISKRAIPAKDWPAMSKRHAVQTDDKGRSLTKDFELPRGNGVHQLTQQMANTNISGPPPAPGAPTQQRPPAPYNPQQKPPAAAQQTTPPKSQQKPPAAASQSNPAPTPATYTTCVIKKQSYQLMQNKGVYYVKWDGKLTAVVHDPKNPKTWLVQAKPTVTVDRMQ